VTTPSDPLPQNLAEAHAMILAQEALVLAQSETQVGRVEIERLKLMLAKLRRCSMNKTNKAFPLIVIRRPWEQDLFEENSPWRYHAVTSNHDNEDAAAAMEWYSKRGDASENRIKDLKIGFGMDSMPCEHSRPTPL
jgi:hypothetical protein